MRRVKCKYSGRGVVKGLGRLKSSDLTAAGRVPASHPRMLTGRKKIETTERYISLSSSHVNVFEYLCYDVLNGFGQMPYLCGRSSSSHSVLKLFFFSFWLQ